MKIEDDLENAKIEVKINYDVVAAEVIKASKESLFSKILMQYEK